MRSDIRTDSWVPVSDELADPAELVGRTPYAGGLGSYCIFPESSPNMLAVFIQNEKLRTRAAVSLSSTPDVLLAYRETECSDDMCQE